jgi:tRNA modification GTPase
MNSPAADSCRVAQLTPSGRGAIAVISVSGHLATNLLARHFLPASDWPLQRTPIGRVRYGRWAIGSTGNEEVVASRMATDNWEVHCHGGSVAAAAIIETLVESGCTRLTGSEWLRQVHRDRISAAAADALAETTTLSAAAVLLDQYRGALARALRQAADYAGQNNNHAARDCLLRVERYADVGLHLNRPWRVVVAGKVNVGKSSLVNALLGFQRALVYRHPGTTRDVVSGETAVAGWPIELVDTAGLRTVADTVEREGVQRARHQIAGADLLLWVVDASDPDARVPPVDRPPTRASLCVANKCDLLPPDATSEEGQLYVSALRGTGIPRLLEAIAQSLVPCPPPAGAAVPFTAEQVDTIRNALDHLNNALPAKACRMLQDLLGC